MEVSDIIKNGNFTAEFPFVIRVTDGYGEIISEHYSCENVPEWLNGKEVVYMDCVNGYGVFSNMAVLVIDVFKED